MIPWLFLFGLHLISDGQASQRSQCRAKCSSVYQNCISKFQITESVVSSKWILANMPEDKLGFIGTRASRVAAENDERSVAAGLSAIENSNTTWTVTLGPDSSLRFAPSDTSLTGIIELTQTDKNKCIQELTSCFRVCK